MNKKSDDFRHILALSGGKDSAALAVYLKDKIPNLEYVFLDTGHELPETYEFLNRMRAVLGISITVLRSQRTFDYWLKHKNYYLPSPKQRWCTELLKIRPYETFIGTNKVMSYIGIRADEDRDGYISHKSNIIPKYPFIEDEVDFDDVQNILSDSGLGFPEYYRWRTRSGCYFCFFQQKIEWLRLRQFHLGLFEKAMQYEKRATKTSPKFTWCDDQSLTELIERAGDIETAYMDRQYSLNSSKTSSGSLLRDILADKDFEPCLICTV